ncbi:MAG: hypothetical protein H6697_06225 [Myxococcales bacterium]|nr:hypothetical protein [Myxococcales bacterium]MCB9520956.1 hypothetical protein [Myxococcales bacterium]
MRTWVEQLLAGLGLGNSGAPSLVAAPAHDPDSASVPWAWAPLPARTSSSAVERVDGDARSRLDFLWLDVATISLADAGIAGSSPVVVPAHSDRVIAVRIATQAATFVVVERAERDLRVAHAVAAARTESLANGADLDRIEEIVWFEARCGRVVAALPVKIPLDGTDAALRSRAQTSLISLSDQSISDADILAIAIPGADSVSGRGSGMSDSAALGQFPDGESTVPPRADLPAGRDVSVPAIRIQDLDWDLPDEVDAASGFDALLLAGQGPRGATDADSGSLPSASSIFGSDFRGAREEPSIRLQAALPGLRDEATAPTEAVSNAPTGPNDAVDLDVVGAEPVEIEPPELDDQFIVNELAPSAARDSLKYATASRTSEAIPVVRVRSAETPIVTPRHLQRTPIIASPVVAARAPTPGPQPQLPADPSAPVTQRAEESVPANGRSGALVAALTALAVAVAVITWLLLRS